MSETFASLMMVTYNRLELTKKMLTSLFETTQYPFFLNIVDNNSTDATVEYLFECCGNQVNNHPYFLGFKVIKNATNRGIAVGRNQCLKAAEGNWLVTLDNDILFPHNHWLTDAINILEKNADYGMIGVNFERTQFPLILRNDLEFQHKLNGNLGTACTVFNRSLFKMLGYFNTEYKIYAHEDADWGFRVKMLGLKLGYLKEPGIHLGEGSQDVGEYREMKNKYHAANLQKFNENCNLYFNKKKPLYIPFKD